MLKFTAIFNKIYMEKVFLNKISYPFKTAVQILSKSLPLAKDNDQILYALSKNKLEKAQIKNFQIHPKITKVLIDEIHLITLIKNYSDEKSLTFQNMIHSNFSNIYLILDKNRSMFFLNENLEEIKKLEIEKLLKLILESEKTKLKEKDISNLKIIKIISFGDKLLLVAHNMIFAFKISFKMAEGQIKIKILFEFFKNINETIGWMDSLQKSFSIKEFVYFVICKNTEKVQVYFNENLEQIIELQSEIICIHKPDITINKNIDISLDVFEEVLIALKNKSIIMIKLNKLDYKILFSFDVRGTQEINSICCYNNFDIWGLTICVERSKKLEIYQEQLSNIYEFKYDIGFKDQIISIEKMLFMSRIDGFLILFKSGIFGIIMERKSLLSHLPNVLDLDKEIKQLQNIKEVQKNKNLAISTKKGSFSNPELFDETLKFESKLIKSDKIEIILKNDFENIKEVLIMKPFLSSLKLLNNKRFNKINNKSLSNSFISFNINSNYFLLEFSLLDDCVPSFDIIIKFNNNFIEKSISIPLLYNFDLIPIKNINIKKEEMSVIHIEGKFRPFSFTKILKTLFRISSINEMNLKKNSFNEKEDKFFLFERWEIKNIKCIFKVSYNKLSIYFNNNKLLEKIEDHLNMVFNEKNFNLNLSAQIHINSFLKLKKSLIKEYILLKKSNSIGNLSVMINEMENNNFLQNGQKFLTFLKGKKEYINEMSQSYLNYNPDKNLSKVLSKSTLAQEKVVVNNEIKELHLMTILSSFSTKPKNEIRDFFEQSNISENSLLNYINNN